MCSGMRSGPTSHHATGICEKRGGGGAGGEGGGGKDCDVYACLHGIYRGRLRKALEIMKNQGLSARKNLR